MKNASSSQISPQEKSASIKAKQTILFNKHFCEYGPGLNESALPNI